MDTQRSVGKAASQSDEDEATHRLAAVLAPRVDALVVRQQGTDHEVASGSSLSTDDRLARPYQLSHAAWHAISHAIDSLHALRTLTVRGHGQHLVVHTHPYAAYPLVRSAIENASRSIWLLAPTSRDERLTRRIRLLLADGRNLDKVAGLTGTGPSDAENTGWDRMTPIITTRALDSKECRKGLGNVTFVRGAAEAIDGSPNESEAIWRALSGLSHGDMWASLAATDRDEVAVSEDGTVVTVRTTSSISNVANLMSVAISITEAALRLFDRQRARHV